jgi:flagellar basal-body rod modification protein FlgD
MTTTAFDSTLSSLGIGRTSSGTTVLPASAANQTLGQADFLKLMTAQMQNQDPFNPTDNTQMVAQMAQFSSLSGITEMNDSLKAIAGKLTGTSTADAMGYVGKNVLTAGKTACPLSTGGLNGAVELAGAASDVSVSISDASGAVLKTVDLGAQPQGTIDYSWDGTTDSGEAAGAGPYTISVNAQNAGAAVGATSLVWAPVTSVSVPASGTPTLNVAGLGSVAVGDVRQIG